MRLLHKFNFKFINSFFVREYRNLSPFVTTASTNCIATCEIVTTLWEALIPHTLKRLNQRFLYLIFWQNAANIHCNKEGKRFFAPYSVDCGRIIIAFIPNMANNDTKPVGALPATPNIQIPNTVYLR